jgi:hypothetical protein
MRRNGGRCNASPALTRQRTTSRSARTRNLQVSGLPRLLPSERGGGVVPCGGIVVVVVGRRSQTTDTLCAGLRRATPADQIRVGEGDVRADKHEPSRSEIRPSSPLPHRRRRGGRWGRRVDDDRRRRRRCRPGSSPERRRGVDDPRRHAGGGDAGPFRFRHVAPPGDGVMGSRQRIAATGWFHEDSQFVLEV